MQRRQFLKGMLVSTALLSIDMGPRQLLVGCGTPAPNAVKLLNGSSQRLRIFDAPALRFGAEDFSVLAWVKVNSATPVTQNRDILAKDGATGWRLFDNGPSGKFGFAIRGFAPYVTAGVPHAIGQWYMVAGGHDQGSGQIWASVDGGAPATALRTTPPDAGTTDLAIGEASSFSGPTLDGAILRLGIWRRKITADLAALYNSGVPLRYADLTTGQKTALVAWWDMSETGGSRREGHAGLYHAYNDVAALIGSEAGIGPAVDAPAAATRQLLCDGDSLTFGYSGQPTDAYYAYPAQAALDLGADWRVTNLVLVAGGSSGTILADAATQIDPLYDPALTKNIIFVWIGTNDLLQSVALATVKSNIQAYVSGRRSAGFTVAIGTLLPNAYATKPAGYDAARADLNAWIVSCASGADTVWDIGADAALADPLNTTYYTSDKLHLTKYGYHVVAQSATALAGTL